MGWIVASVLGLALLAACRKIEVTQAEVRDLEISTRKDMANMLAHLSGINAKRDGAYALRAAAEKWDDLGNDPWLKALIKREYVPGGPSAPAIFMRHEAAVLTDTAADTAVDTTRVEVTP